MHYYVDGYNLLFRTEGPEDLRSSRERLILDFAKKATALHLTLTLVFDSSHPLSMLTRSHLHQLEIVYTEKKQSADAYILNQIQIAATPFLITVVTSDKKLAAFARQLGAKTLSVDLFLPWLNRRYLYRNNLKQRECDKKATPNLGSHQGLKAPESDQERWLRIFEKKLKKCEDE